VGPPDCAVAQQKGMPMNELPFKRFIDLVTFDQQIRILTQEIRTLTQEVEELDDSIDSLGAQVQIAKNHWHASKKDVDAKELEMKTLDTAEKELQKKIDVVQNSREYSSIKKEIDALKKKQHEFETVLVESWQKIESAQRDYDACNAIYEEKINAIGASIEEKTKHIEEKKRAIASLELERPAQMVNLPAEWLEKYTMMQSRIINPVVPVVDGICSACFYTISQQDIASLRKRKLLQCKDCYRFLYMESAMNLSDQDNEQESNL
jgi:predicted  nucleic acid-binding Zn-ribbon protein